jgi:hypothetical protein
MIQGTSPHVGAVHKNRDVQAHAVLVVKHVAPHGGMAREHIGQRLAHRGTQGINAAVRRDMAQMRREKDFSHGTPCVAMVPQVRRFRNHGRAQVPRIDSASMTTADHLRAAFAKAVYLHAVGGPLTHNAGCLAEGLHDLGIPFKLGTAEITSRPASLPLKGLDLSAMVSPPYAGFDGYIVDISHTNRFAPFEGIAGGRLAYLNQSDTASFSRIPDEHLLFVAHENTFAAKGGRRHPVAFGPSNGLIAATEKRPAFGARRRAALRNFRATLSQSLRALLDISYVPALARRLPVDDRILATDAYLDALLNTSVCLAYGGDLYSPIMGNPWFARHTPETAAAHTFERLNAPAMVMRWDSFRLWESFAAGCLTVHLDFAKYGFALPVAPVAWTHYVPIDLDNIAGSVAHMLDREKEWADIAEQGRAWAIAHYAPRPTATRVLTAMLENP